MTGSGTVVVVEVVEVVVVVAIVCTAARIQRFRPDTFRHTTMTGLPLTRIETRVPNGVFVQLCPIAMALALTAGIANHSKIALNATLSFFT